MISLTLALALDAHIFASFFHKTIVVLSANPSSHFSGLLESTVN